MAIVPLPLLHGIISFGYDILFDESSDEESDRNVIEKISNYVETVVPNFKDYQFRQHFRMHPTTFEDLLRRLHTTREIGRGQPQLSHEKQIMICIWYLANMESLRSVADRFGVSKSSAWNVLKRVSAKIISMNPEHRILVWPNLQRAQEIINSFERVNGFPGVIGCIDGSHIKILPPTNYPNSYYNRKKFHSVLLQAVCDHRKLFLDVYAGEPGSMHDSRVFQKSDLYERINSNNIEFPNNSHLIGDLAYTLSKTLMVGFKDNGNLTNRQRNYNQRLSQVRVTVENALALLKGRFRRLKFMETIRLDLICLLIVTSCFLHNICILNGDPYEDLMDINQEIGEIRNNENHVDGNNILQRNRREAIEKRNNIVLNLQ